MRGSCQTCRAGAASRREGAGMRLKQFGDREVRQLARELTRIPQPVTRNLISEDRIRIRPPARRGHRGLRPGGKADPPSSDRAGLWRGEDGAVGRKKPEFGKYQTTLHPNPGKPEPKGINHENTKVGKHEIFFSFAFSSFRAFVINMFFHKMQRIHK